MNDYIGITLGPIHDAMMLAAHPAGLWMSSYLFSKMAYDICSRLLQTGISVEQFVVPYFEVKDGKIVLPAFDEERKQDTSELMKRGLGFFHDRIIIKVEETKEAQEFLKETKELIDEIVLDYSSNLLKLLNLQGLEDNTVSHIAALKAFFQVYGVSCRVQSNQSPVLSVSSALDQLEMQHKFSPVITRDYLYEIFNDNDLVKGSFLVQNLQNWQLLDSDRKEGTFHIRNIDQIGIGFASPSERSKKKYQYYAVVQADGDRMGKTLGKLTSIDKIREYSKKCLKYAALCSKEILAYGGVVIYAGGDDLLFLAPVESYSEEKGKNNLLELVDKLKYIFKECKFSNDNNEKNGPALSVGISIQYHKFPLYEALKKAEEMLFTVAKKTRDTLAINMNKGSGHGIQFIITDYSKTTIASKIGSCANQANDTTLISSILHHIEAYKAVFMQSICHYPHNNEILENTFSNVFDSEIHKEEKSEKAIKMYRQLMEQLLTERNVHVETEKLIQKESESEQQIVAYAEILRFIKLFSEEAGENV